MRPTSLNASVRRAAVAGLFYPADAGELRAAVSGYLRQSADLPQASLASPSKALIAPHAGYIYSGAIAAAAYAHVAPQRERIRRIVLIGPSHRVYLTGGAVPHAAAFETPLGTVVLDAALKESLLQRGDVLHADEPHEFEHGLEVHLPFLQMSFADFTLLPIVVGQASPDYVAALLRQVWGGPETLVLASSDLSHYHPYEVAQALDAKTSATILRREALLDQHQACGAVVLNGLLRVAAGDNLTATQLARCNSGDTAGDRARVVGYGAFAFHSSPDESVS